MKKIAILLLAMFVSIVNAQNVYLRSWGSSTCGEALADINKNSTYKRIYSAYLDGYISKHNWDNDSTLTSKISPNTIEQLWIAKCSQVANITKLFPIIANEIIKEAKIKNE